MIDTVCWFSSKSRNTERLVNKLSSLTNELTYPINYIKIPKSIQEATDIKLASRYIILCPSYGDGTGKGSVPPQVVAFLKANRGLLSGVIGTGNKNFGKYYAWSANIISHKLQVPILYKVELAGTETDIKSILKGLTETWN